MSKTRELGNVPNNIRQVDTLADMRTIEFPHETVWCSGYHSKNDGAFGSNIYRWNPTSTATDNGGTIIKLTSITTGRYELQYSNKTIGLEYFGITGIGDETIKIQNWLNCLSNGLTLIGKKLTCTVTSLVIPRFSNVTIDFNGLELVSTSNLVITLQNSTTSLGNITANMTKGDTVIQMANTTNISIGDVVRVVSTGVQAVSSSGNYVKGELFTIIDKTSTSVTVKESVYYPNIISEVSLLNLNVVQNVNICNLNVKVSSETQSCMLVYNMKDSSIYNCKFTSISATGSLNALLVAASSNVEIYKNSIDNFKFSTYNGYGIAVSGNDIIVRDNNISRCKHNITSGSREFLCKGIKYYNNSTFDSVGSSLDFHYNVVYSEACNNKMVGCAGGIYVRGNGDTVIDSNIFSDMDETGIDLTCDNQNEIVNNIVISNNVFDIMTKKYSTGCIACSSTTVSFKGLVITGNVFSNAFKGVSTKGNIVSAIISNNYFSKCQIAIFDFENATISNNNIIVDKSDASHQILLNAFGNNTVITGNSITYSSTVGEAAARAIRLKPFKSYVFGNVFTNYTNTTNEILDESTGLAKIGTNFSQLR